MITGERPSAHSVIMHKIRWTPGAYDGTGREGTSVGVGVAVSGREPARDRLTAMPTTSAVAPSTEIAPTAIAAVGTDEPSLPVSAGVTTGCWSSCDSSLCSICALVRAAFSHRRE